MQKVWWRLLKWYAFFMLAASPVWKEVALSGRYIAHICPGRWFWFETGIRPSRGAPNCGGAGSSGGTTCHESNEDLESHRVTELRTVFISPDVESFEQLQATPEKQPENLNFKESAVWKSEVFQHNWNDVFVKIHRSLRWDSLGWIGNGTSTETVLTLGGQWNYGGRFVCLVLFSMPSIGEAGGLAFQKVLLKKQLMQPSCQEQEASQRQGWSDLCSMNNHEQCYETLGYRMMAYENSNGMDDVATIVLIMSLLPEFRDFSGEVSKMQRGIRFSGVQLE